MFEQLVVKSVSSRSFIVVKGTIDVPGLNPNVHGVLSLQVMMQISCLAIVEEEEVRNKSSLLLK